MKAMGLRPGVNWIAWFISSYFQMVIVAFFVALILKYCLIFANSNLFLIFLMLLCFGYSTVMLSFFVGSFFTKTNLASLIGILSYFVSYLPFILVMSLKYEIQLGAKIGLCFSAATAFGYSSLYLSWYEQQGKGLQYETVFQSPVASDKMCFGYSLILMVVDGCIYGIAGWYVKNVFPSRYGASKPWYFILTPKFWSNTIFCSLCRSSGSLDEYEKDGSFRHEKKNNNNRSKPDKFIELEPMHLPVGISVKGLTRKFGDRTVVDNLTLKFFEGQITGLLGHNGAGKSTTINVLTGVYAPTHGTAYIYNRDVRYEYNQIRKNVGICPQHDILFDYMTVKEHLIFYGKLKENMGSRELSRDIHDMMNKMGLTAYSNSYASALSGGLRRRLGVAIAFVSGSKTVILDEPTSGVDPYNRMKIWDIILEYRMGRTILLTTHYLEEADILSDRIAIIHQGKLQCCGSSFFLKNKFGSGYILTIDRKLFNPSSMSMVQSKQMIAENRAKSIETISKYIMKYIPGATLTRHINNTINFTLPYNQKMNFEGFFSSLEKNKNNLEIASYGISDTTLEEIFLLLTMRDDEGNLKTNTLSLSNKVANNLSTTFSESDRDSAIELGNYDVTSSKSSAKGVNFKENSFHSPAAITMNTSMDSMSHNHLTNSSFGMPNNYTKLKGRSLYIRQFTALIIKRFNHYRRNMRVILTNVLLPCLFVALSMAFTIIRPSLDDQPSLEMSPVIYEPTETFSTFDKTNNLILKALTHEFVETFDTICKEGDYYADAYNSGSSLSQQKVNNYLCEQVSKEVKKSQISLKKKLSIFDINLFSISEVLSYLSIQLCE
jgi:ABC-type multidrug transport system ATPase subunit